jgi:spermidine synthase
MWHKNANPIHKLNFVEHALFSIFFISGMVSIIYQVAWQRLLSLYCGVNYISITIIVSVFMFGLGLGALVGGRYIDKLNYKNKLKIYLLIEISIGVFGILSLRILEIISVKTVGSSYLFVFFYSFLFLSIPTFLMGTTLPVLCSIFSKTNPNFLRNISFLYFINTLGAAIGTILCAYILISFFGIDKAIYFAALLNFLLAAAILTAIIFSKPPPQKEAEKWQSDNKRVLTLQLGYIIIFVTGFLALGYEILWFRLLSILTKSSPYSFASTLFVYLLGIALGSYYMHKFVSKNRNFQNKSTFYLLQGLIASYVILSTELFYYAIKHTPINQLARLSFVNVNHPLFGYNFYGTDSLVLQFFILIWENLDVFIWASFFVFIPTLMMGASFPLMSSLVLKEKDKTGLIVGGLYFFNVLGNMSGGLITGFVLLPNLKTIHTIILFTITGMIFFLFINEELFIKSFGRSPRYIRLLSILCIIFLLALISPSNDEFYSTIHFVSVDKMTNESWKVRVEEGADNVIVTVEYPDGRMRNFINGLGHGGRPGYPFYEENSMQLSYAKDAKDILLIGFGTGSTAETVLKLDGVRNITVVELSESLIKNLRKFDQTDLILENKKLNIIIDDGRRYLYKTNKTFDIILMDPLRVSEAYSNNIYSAEFFHLIKNHLNDGGVFGLYNDMEYNVLPNTVLQEFRFINVYGIYIIASDNELIKNETVYTQLFNSFDKNSQMGILKTRLNTSAFIGNESTLNKTIDNKKILTDYTPWLEYRFGYAFENQILPAIPKYISKLLKMETQHNEAGRL